MGMYHLLYWVLGSLDSSSAEETSILKKCSSDFSLVKVETVEEGWKVEVTAVSALKGVLSFLGYGLFW